MSFGTGISYANGETFLLQPGFYLVQWSANAVLSIPETFDAERAFMSVGVRANALFEKVAGYEYFGRSLTAIVSVNGNTLLQITGANTVVSFDVEFLAGSSASLQEGCRIIFTRLQ